MYKNDPEQKLSAVEALELEIRKTIVDNIENWALYEKASDAGYKKFGNDAACGPEAKGNADFIDYQKKASEGDVYKLDLSSGAYLVYTPNYNNWDNAKLSSFGISDMRICSAGWLIPLYAYPDKIVWGNITCSTGAENPEVDNCLKITQIIMGHFTTKSK